MTPCPKSNRNLSVSCEDAYQAVIELMEAERDDLSGVTVYSGVHPIHGNIHIVIPAMGESLLLLPFEVQDR